MTELKALLPSPTDDSREFWAACNDGVLLLRSCRACAHCFYYPRQACPKCGSRDLEWRRSRGTATVFSYSHVHTSFYGSFWESQLPYTVVLVDLSEGPRMLSRLVGADHLEVRAGDPVEVQFELVESQKLPFFHRIVHSRVST